MHDYSDTDTDDNFDAPDDSLRHHEFMVAEGDAGQRLDRFLAAQFPDVSRTHVQTLIDEGRVRVSGVTKKPSHHLESGETITVEIPAPPLPGVEAENIPLDILYEDEDIAIVNKPAGMIVHPGAGADTGTLVAALLHRFGVEKGLSSVGGPLRPGIVHRLDKGTSGAIVIARNDAAHLKLVEDFRDRRVQKTYLTLLHGSAKGETGRIELPVARDLRRRSRMTARRNEGREARTDWRLRFAPRRIFIDRSRPAHRSHAPDSRAFFGAGASRRGRHRLRRAAIRNPSGASSCPRSDATFCTPRAWH